MRIVGLDPGSIKTGYACIQKTDSGAELVAQGTFHLGRPKASASASFPARLKHSFSALR